MSATVLVIEDNPVNMKLTRSLLDLLGCRVLEAEESGKGLSILETHDVDLVLMDIQLPGMDGLSICRIIREEMGRTDLPVIAVSALAMEGDRENALDRGFDDYITKPVSTRQFLELVSSWLSGEKKKVARRPAQADVPQVGRKVLLVDDDKTNVKVMASMLAEEPYEILEAYNGRDALEMAAGALPDVIFLDIMMPDLDGFEVTGQLKANPDTAHIPIVLVTALEGMDARVRGLDLGAEDVLVKPVNRLEVVARARSMIRMSEYQRQLALREQATGLLAAEPTAGRRASPLKDPCILLVEDNPKDADLLLATFASSSYEIEVVETGSRAEQRLAEKAFDLVLLDLVLPDMDGLDLLQRIKESRDPGSPQVVVITALKDLETRLKGIEWGADDYLVKPVHSRELQARVQVLLRKKGYLDRLRSHYQVALSAAIKDDLTGIYNRAYFNRYLDLELKRARRQKYPVSLVMADIDAFKSYNTRFGHLVGDVVIREVAGLLKNSFREVDLVARFGGDEFVIVLPYCSRQEVDEIVERACRAVSTHPFPAEEDLTAGILSISTGTASFPDDAGDAAEMVKRADEALRSAKEEKGMDTRLPMEGASP